ncbi:hypothetical protein ACH3XW_26480 [Acanthocheilonema viteae]
MLSITSCVTFIDMLLLLFILLFTILSSGYSQATNTNNLPLPLLTGYGMDMCRYMSCPYGQQCLNGVCWSSTPLLTTTITIPNNFNPFPVNQNTYPGYMNPLLTTNPWFISRSGSIMSERLCPTKANCYGQTCLHSGCFYSTATYNSGTQPCTLTEQCPIGQICVSGFCLPSNIAQIGNQNQQLLISCSTGAPCPVGYYCINGFCTRNAFTSTFACSHGQCPSGMICYMGRCTSSSFFGK